MANDLDFSLPDEAEKALRKKNSKAGGSGNLFSFLTLAGVLLLIVRGFFSGGISSTGSGPSSVDAETGGVNTDLALKLERRGLQIAAAHVWEEELSDASKPPQERANLLFKVGRLYQEGGDSEKAVEYYYRAEMEGKDELSDDVKFEIDRRVQECFETLGMFAALEEELTARTHIGGDEEAATAKENEVLAEIGRRKITRRDLKRSMEQMVDLQLQSMGGSIDPAQRMAYKEQLMGQVDEPQMKAQILNEVINKELLYRLAKELRIDEKPEMTDLMQETMRQILSGKALEAELDRRIQLTDADFETYYKANQERYRQPAMVELSVLLNQTQDDVNRVREVLAGGEKFEDAASRFSVDETTRDNGGRLPAPLSRDQIKSTFGLEDDAIDSLFTAEAGEVLPGDFQTAKGIYLFRVESNQPERMQSYGEMKGQVEQELLSRKQQETVQKILEELRERERVVVHMARLAPQEQASEDTMPPDPDPHSGSAPDGDPGKASKDPDSKPKDNEGS